MVINNLNSGASGSEIIVLSGGTLTLSINTLQNFTINNYGTLSLHSTIGSGAVLKTNSSLSAESLTVDPNGLLYVNGDITAKNLKVNSGKAYAKNIQLTNNSAENLYLTSGTLVAEGTINCYDAKFDGNSNLYCNDFTVKNNIYATSTSSIIVMGDISTVDLKLDSNTSIFSNCSINATGKISMENSAVVSVKGRMYAATLIHMNNTASINIMSGGLIQTPGKMEINGTTGLKISVLGSEMGGLLVGGILSSDNTFDWSQTFKGNIGIVAGSVGFWSATKTWSDITKSSNMIIDTKKINVPKNSCSPGYNPNTTEDTGMAWFDYPLETENISDCYDFNAWTKGNFDMTKKSGAKVFDSNNANPADGSGLKVYELK